MDLSALAGMTQGGSKEAVVPSNYKQLCAQINVQKRRKEEKRGKHDGGDKNYFFNASARAVDASVAAEDRRKPAPALLHQNADDKEKGDDNLRDVDDGMHMVFAIIMYFSTRPTRSKNNIDILFELIENFPFLYEYIRYSNNKRGDGKGI